MSGPVPGVNGTTIVIVRACLLRRGVGRSDSQCGQRGSSQARYPTLCGSVRVSHDNTIPAPQRQPATPPPPLPFLRPPPP